MEFVSSSAAHSHFLFINTLIFLKKIFPAVESREIGRFVTLISAGLSVSVLYLIIYKLIANRFYSLVGSMIFAFSFSFWKNAEILEVYTYNLLFISLFILFCLKFLLEKRSDWLMYASLFLGLSLWIHIQNILMIPAFIFLIYRSKQTNFQLFSLMILFVFFAGLFLVAAINNDPLMSVFSSGTVSDNINMKNILKNIIIGAGYLVYNFWYFLFFLFLGIKALFKKDFILSVFLVAATVPIFGFASIFAVSDNYVYFIPFNFIAAIFIGIGLFSVREKKFNKIIAFSFLLIPTFYFLSLKLIGQIPQGIAFDKTKEYKGGLRYYLLPWMNDNVGILQFTIDKKNPPENIEWMTKSANELIEIKSKYQSIECIRKL